MGADGLTPPRGEGILLFRVAARPSNCPAVPLDRPRDDDLLLRDRMGPLLSQSRGYFYDLFPGINIAMPAISAAAQMLLPGAAAAARGRHVELVVGDVGGAGALRDRTAAAEVTTTVGSNLHLRHYSE